ncbi:glyoxalase [Nocardioides sp. SYSU DS0651]|uniref:glyoxalase n=1 Tax=Nocardioides sp. SYSU DS0651 TaxID=3415955 RepID=UPI003F4B0ABD
MTHIEQITLEVADTAAAALFYKDAFGLDGEIGLRESTAPTSGFRAFTLSLLVAQPADVRLLVDSAVGAGAEVLKPVAKSMWGHGGVVRAPDGTIWKVATSARKDTSPATGHVEHVVLLLGAADVAATKRFYVEHGMGVAKSFGRKYVEFESPEGAVKLGLYGRKALAKDAGVDPDGTGSHRVVLHGAGAPFTDPDGFVWEPTA